MSFSEMHQPPRPLAILIYGTSASQAAATIADKAFKQTLTEVGHRVSVCGDPTTCNQAGTDNCPANTKRNNKKTSPASANRLPMLLILFIYTWVNL